MFKSSRYIRICTYVIVLQDSEARIDFEVDLRAQLSRQAAAHSDHIVEVLKVQERELEAKFQLKLSEHIQKEKEAFQQQVAGWVARLHGIEAALDSKILSCLAAD